MPLCSNYLPAAGWTGTDDHVHKTRCTNEAEFDLFNEKEEKVPGGPFCQRCAEACINEYKEKLGWTWTMQRLELTRTFYSKPDKEGKAFYLETWYDPHKAHCAVCGKPSPGQYPYNECPHFGTPEYGRCAQAFYMVPPKDHAQVIHKEP